MNTFYICFAGIMARPVAASDVMPKKVFVMQLLSRINEGEKLGETAIYSFLGTAMNLHLLKQVACKRS